jgi:hypothetical protein
LARILIPVASALLIAIAAGAAWGQGSGSGETSRGVTAFVGVHVLPMDAERVLENQTVLIEGDRIVAIGPSAHVKIPEDARVIEGAGRWLMPGLADMHVHTWDANEDRLFVAFGVTTVRNLFGSPMHQGWARGTRSTPAPHLLTTAFPGRPTSPRSTRRRSWACP